MTRWAWRASCYSPLGTDSLALNVLRIYQSKALSRLIRLSSARSSSYFLLLEKASTESVAVSQHTTKQNGSLPLELHLHDYLNRLITLSRNSLSILASGTSAKDDMTSLPETATLSNMAVGQLLLPLLRLLSGKELACPRLMEPLCSLLPPIQTLRNVFCRY